MGGKSALTLFRTATEESATVNNEIGPNMQRSLIHQLSNLVTRPRGMRGDGEMRFPVPIQPYPMPVLLTDRQHLSDFFSMKVLEYLPFGGSVTHQLVRAVTNLAFTYAQLYVSYGMGKMFSFKNQRRKGIHDVAVEVIFYAINASCVV